MPGNLSLVLLGDGTAGNAEEIFVLGNVLGSVGVACLCAACLVVETLPRGLCEFFLLCLGLTGISSSNPSLRAR